MEPLKSIGILIFSNIYSYPIGDSDIDFSLFIPDKYCE